MIGSVKDVEESRLDKSPRRLQPTRVKWNDAWIAAELVGANGPFGCDIAQDRDHLRG